MQFRLNGELKNLISASLTELIALEGLQHEATIAVALNDQVVPRAHWPETHIASGDTVEIVKPFSGG